MCAFVVCAPCTKGTRAAAALSPRCGLHSPEPNAIPQTVEHALLLAHQATKNALLEAEATRIQITLPMGRSRRYWYRMSPPSLTFAESATLTLHYAQLFRGLCIGLALGTGVEELQRVPWVAHVGSLVDEVPSDVEVLIIGAARESQKKDVLNMVQKTNTRLVVLFNSFLDTPVGTMEQFQDVYVCRAMEKVAVLKEQHKSSWDIFAEIGVFEYEWVGVKECTAQPTQEEAEKVLAAYGMEKRGVNGYYISKREGHHAGFWPFMSIASILVPPLPAPVKKKKKLAKERPFGFF